MISVRLGFCFRVWVWVHLFTWSHPVRYNWCRRHNPAGVELCWASHGRTLREEHSNPRSLCDSPHILCSPDSTAPPPEEKQKESRVQTRKLCVCVPIAKPKKNKSKRTSQTEQTHTQTELPFTVPLGRGTGERQELNVFLCQTTHSHTHLHTKAP